MKKRRVAVKTYDRETLLSQPLIKRMVRTEIENLRRVKGQKNIINLKEVYDSENGVQILTYYAGDQSLYSYISQQIKRMELNDESRAPGIIFNRASDSVQKKVLPALEEHQVKKIMQQLLRAVGVIHTLGIVHRDIKPDNIIVK